MTVKPTLLLTDFLYAKSLANHDTKPSIDELMHEFALIKQIEENQSLLVMSATHLTERTQFVIKDRILQLKKELDELLLKQQKAKQSLQISQKEFNGWIYRFVVEFNFVDAKPKHIVNLFSNNRDVYELKKYLDSRNNNDYYKYTYNILYGVSIENDMDFTDFLNNFLSITK